MSQRQLQRFHLSQLVLVRKIALKEVAEIKYFFTHSAEMGLSLLRAPNPSSVCLAGPARCKRSTATTLSLRDFWRCSLAALGVG
jgi:hypothetical protein